MNRTPKFKFLLAAVLLLPLNTLLAEEILVAVASNFSAPMAVLASEFESETGHQINLVYGSSGRLFAQIQNGAPFQVFLSADQEKPQLLEARQLVVPGSRFTYATGVLVLWSADSSNAPLGPEALDLQFDRLAIANEQLAPYGQASIEVLMALGRLSELQSKLVRGENIAQTYQFVETGNAEFGFVALSQVGNLEGITKGSGWVIPPELHQPILQDAVQLNSSSNCDACTQFMNYLQTERARSAIADFGYRRF